MAFNTHQPFTNLIFRVVLLFTLLGGAVFAKYSPIEELKEDGFYGRVHAWGGIARKFHKTEVKVPFNAPVIISDYLSTVGSNGLGRGRKHRGIDIFEEVGSPIIAAADGRVVRAKVDKCWGPTMLIRHGRDKNGRRLYALYGHVKNFAVKVGDKVKRGQKIAEMGNDIYTSCGAGFHHLHFQLSYNPRKVPILGWGWANFVRDGFNSPNPHDYWEDGKGRITCYEDGKKYSASGLTYPVPCKNKPHDKKYSNTMVAGKALDDDIMPSLEEVYRALELDEAAEAQAAAQAQAQSVREAQVIRELTTMEQEWEEQGGELNIEHSIALSAVAESVDLEREYMSSGLRYLDSDPGHAAADFLDDFFKD